MLVNSAIQRQRGFDGELHGALVQDRQGAGQAETNRAGVGIGRIAELRRAGAEDLGFGKELDVDFQADDDFVFRHHFRRDSHLCGILGHEFQKL